MAALDVLLSKNNVPPLPASIVYALPLFSVRPPRVLLPLRWTVSGAPAPAKMAVALAALGTVDDQLPAVPHELSCAPSVQVDVTSVEAMVSVRNPPLVPNL